MYLPHSGVLCGTEFYIFCVFYLENILTLMNVFWGWEWTGLLVSLVSCGHQHKALRDWTYDDSQAEMEKGQKGLPSSRIYKKSSIARTLFHRVLADQEVSSQLLFLWHAYLPAPMLSTMMVTVFS